MLNYLLQRTKIGKLGLTPPSPRDDRHGLAIALVVRNEERHIAEWARFHALAGTRQFIVYDDASTDGTVTTLRETLPPQQLTVIPWGQRLVDSRLGRQLHNQVLAYAHAAVNFGADHRWMAFIDVDEFLVPTQADNLDHALAHLGPEVRNVSLPWHNFGRGGHETIPPGGVVTNYRHRAADPMAGGATFKCIVDPCHLTAIRVHAMEVDHDTRTWNDRGEACSLNQRHQRRFYSTDHLQLNHYYTRSAEELEQKIRRGPNLPAKAGAYRRKVMRTVEQIERRTVADETAIAFLARCAEESP